MSEIGPICVIAAHPDDEVLGCGGTIAKWIQHGLETHIIVLGEGITSRFEQRDQADRSALATLREHCVAAADVLGASSLYHHDLPDNRFDQVPLLDIIKLIENKLHDIGPKTVFTHHGADLNIDHQIVHRAVLTATRPVPGTPVDTVYAFEVGSSTEWAFQQFAAPFRANVFVDITETLPVKIEAMAAYTSELRDFPHPRSSVAITSTAQRWGAASGVVAAEPFELVRTRK